MSELRLASLSYDENKQLSLCRRECNNENLR